MYERYYKEVIETRRSSPLFRLAALLTGGIAAAGFLIICCAVISAGEYILLIYAALLPLPFVAACVVFARLYSRPDGYEYVLSGDAFLVFATFGEKRRCLFSLDSALMSRLSEKPKKFKRAFVHAEKAVYITENGKNYAVELSEAMLDRILGGREN